MDIEALGFDAFFRERLESVDARGAQPCRVISVHKNSYVVSNGDKDIYAEATGRLLQAAASPLDLPTVGDWILAQLLDDDTFSVIHSVIARKTLLARKTAGKSTDYQPIAANIDVAFIVQALDCDFNLRRLERYLAMVIEGGTVPVVLLSKRDLVDEQRVAASIQHIRENISGVDVHALSNESGQGLDAIEGLLEKGSTYCLIGSSGVGKTTLLNKLLGGGSLETRAVRSTDGKGRHVTTARQLVALAGGALVIDTPGMRELGNIDIGHGIEVTFDEIAAAAASCRFSDCSHVDQEGCNVLAAVSDGTISRDRYEAFIKLKKETEFHGMTYRERRQKDREFGKMVKSVMKHKKKRKG